LNQISAAAFCRRVDHTLLKAVATEKDIEDLCQEASAHQFFAVCVNPFYVSLAKKNLQGTSVRIATVCNFPLGASSSLAAQREAEVSLSEGANEVDMVLNLGAFKSGRTKIVEQEIAALKKICGDRVLKVILEVSLLSADEIVSACRLADTAGADFVKTSTGFSTGGASVEAVALMKKNFSRQVKASGGIRAWAQAKAMIDAGADRLGLSASVAILGEIS